MTHSQNFFPRVFHHNQQEDCIMTTATIDGKAQLLEYINQVHPNEEILIADLARGRRYALPNGFEVNSNPLSLSMTVLDPDRIMVFGPIDGSGVSIRVGEKAAGSFVRGIDLIVSIAQLLKTGPPIHQRSLTVLGDWWKREIANCDPFTVPAPGPKTRAELEQHIDRDANCQRALPSFISAIDASGNPVSDAMLVEFIEKAGTDVEGAISYYTTRRNGLLGIPATPAPKPRKRAAAVEAEVPA
jgi:hypothetical protein